MAKGTQRYVIWISLKKAIVGFFDENDLYSYKTMYSGIDTRVRFPGETSNKVRLNTSKRTRETSENRKLDSQLVQFCKDVISQVHNPASVLLLGPSDTKLTLSKIFSGSKKMESVPLNIKSADNMKLTEIKEAAAKHFRISLRKPTTRRRAY